MKKNSVRTYNGLKSKLILVAVFALVALLMIGTKVYRNKAYGNSYDDKYVVSIQIEEGDTLWGIASRYYIPECGSMKQYVKEICKTNSLKSDSIHAGNYLLIPCYTSACK